MRLIAKREGAATDTSRDYEYTDWAALDRFVNELVDTIPGITSSTRRVESQS